MWEKPRVDGSRRLKHNAVPTIFSFTKEKKTRKPPKERNTGRVQVLTELISASEVVSMPSTSSVPSPSRLATTSAPRLATHVDTDTDSSTTYDSSSIDKSDESLSKVREKLCFYERNYKKLSLRNRVLKSKLRNSKQRVKNLSIKLKEKTRELNDDQNVKLLCSVFTNDQIRAMKQSMKFQQRSNQTIQKALKLKFACGNNGYHELLKQHIPLPSLRTLSSRLQNLKFESGILEDIFQFLALKISSMKNEHEKDCGIVLDEMSITSSNMYDMSTKKYIGSVTLPGHSGTATNALVFMIVGISSRWKQTVAYYFTGSVK